MPKLIAWKPEPHGHPEQIDDLVRTGPNDMGAPNSFVFSTMKTLNATVSSFTPRAKYHPLMSAPATRKCRCWARV
jgi:hypothetical protein